MRTRIALALSVASVGLSAAGPAAATDVVTSSNGANVYAGGAVLRAYDKKPSGALEELGWNEPGGTFLALSPDGTVLYEAVSVGGNYQNAIRIFTRDPGSGVLTYERTFLEAGAKSFDLISGMALSPDGRFLYVAQGGHWSPYYGGQASGDPAIHVLSTGSDGEQLSFAQTLWQEDHGMAAIDAIVLAPGGQLYASGDGGIRRFDRNAATGELTPIAGVTPVPQVGPLVLAPDGSRLYAGAHSWEPEAYDVFDRDASTGELTRIAGSADHCMSETCPVGDVLGTSPDGRTVFSAPRAYPHSRILVQGAVTDDGVVPERSYGRAALPDAEKPYAIAWSPDGTFAYLASENRAGNDVVLSVLRWNAQARSLSLVETQKGTRKGPTDQFPTISINDGELATNDPNVTIRFEPPAGATSFRLSNDVDTLDEGHAIRVSEAGVYHWRLDTSGPPSRTVRKVYLRVTQSWDFHQSRPVELFDDIVFDQQPPEIDAAHLEAARTTTTLVVRAHDRASGLKGLQVATNPKHPRRPRKFAHRVTVQGKPVSLYVRVIDGAGNRGRWKLAKRG